MPEDKTIEKILTVGVAAGILIAGLVAGTWWQDGNVLKGVIALTFMTVFVVHFGTKIFKNKGGKIYFYTFMLTPLAIAYLSFFYGFVR